MKGATSWSQWLKKKPDAKEPDWHTYFTNAVKALNEKKLPYLMGRSVDQTFEDDGRPLEMVTKKATEKNEAVYLATQGHQARMLKKNRERILRNQNRVAGGAFRVPKPQMGPRKRGFLPNWSSEVYRDAEVRGTKLSSDLASCVVMGVAIVMWRTVPIWSPRT